MQSHLLATPPNVIRDRQSGGTASTASLRTDLELSRTEIRTLREERDKLKAALQRSLGQQLDQAATKDLVARIDELTSNNHELSTQLQQVQQENTQLQQRLDEAEDDLAAAPQQPPPHDPGGKPRQ